MEVLKLGVPAGLKAAVAGQLSSGASKTNTGSDSLSNDLSKAITNQLPRIPLLLTS